MRKRTVIIGLVVVGILALGWYWFRPELLFIDAHVNEGFPESRGTQAAVLAKGTFHSVAHQSKGVATVYRLADGKRVLRFTDFETSNGPAVRVYLVAARDATDNTTVKSARTIDLGVLKGNKGDQNYDLPPDVDLDTFRAVTVWCERFSVNFATAPLTAENAG
jgi:hypothetical protein